MSLSNEMRRLTKGFPAAYDDRVAMVATIRDNAARELSGFHAAHESMAVETARELSGFRAAHQSMAVEQRQRLAAGRARLASDAGKMRGNVADYAYGLRDNVAKMLESLDTAHQSMAAEQRQHLAEFGAAHQSMAVEQRQRLADGRARLASDVSRMRGNLADYVSRLALDVSKMRGRLHADHSEARKIWDGFATVMRERRAKKSGAPSPKAQTAKAQKPAPPAAGRAIADDLTTIKGLGAGRQLSLNKMGIHTFAQLAKSAPQKIRKALGASGPLANVEEWIKEARKHGK